MYKPSISWRVTAAALSVTLAGLPLAARAQVYKCRQADGTTSFQGSPCPGSLKAPVPASTAADRRAAGSGSTSAPSSDPYAQSPNSGTRAGLGLPPARGGAAAPPATPAPMSDREIREAAERKWAAQEESVIAAENERKRKETMEANARTAANNKVIMCNHARQQLDVARTERPVFTTDDKGERHYIEDADRKRLIETQQQRVNAECN